jgi:hypothetical protein
MTRYGRQQPSVQNRGCLSCHGSVLKGGMPSADHLNLWLVSLDQALPLTKHWWTQLERAQVERILLCHLN